MHNLVDKINKIGDSTADAFYGLHNIEFEHVASITIKFLDESFTGGELDVLRLKLLRKLIENENKKMVLPSAEWERSDWNEFEREIHDKQSQVVKLDIVPVFYRKMCENHNN